MPSKLKTKDNNIKMYKNKLFVRNNNIIYYGNPYDRYIIKIEPSESKLYEDLEVASEVLVAMVDLGEECQKPGKILKTSKKNGVWPAMDIANAWLERIRLSSQTS